MIKTRQYKVWFMGKEELAEKYYACATGGALMMFAYVHDVDIKYLEAERVVQQGLSLSGKIWAYLRG